MHSRFNFQRSPAVMLGVKSRGTVKCKRWDYKHHMCFLSVCQSMFTPSPIKRAELWRWFSGRIAHTSQERWRQQAWIHHDIISWSAHQAAQNVLHIFTLWVSRHSRSDLRRQRGQGLWNGIGSVSSTGGWQICVACGSWGVVISDAGIIAAQREAVLSFCATWNSNTICEDINNNK